MNRVFCRAFQLGMKIGNCFMPYRMPEYIEGPDSVLRLPAWIKEKGVKIAYVTLHVGLGTFRPVKEENIEDHKMHKEHFYIKEEDENKVNKLEIKYLAKQKYGDLAGLAQQYLFYWKREIS